MQADGKTTERNINKQRLWVIIFCVTVHIPPCRLHLVYCNDKVHVWFPEDDFSFNSSADKGN